MIRVLDFIRWRLRMWKYRKVYDVARDEVAIDFGANVGKITNKLSRHGATVYAFEPDPYAFKVLQDTFKNRENVICINKAISDHAGVAKLYFDSRVNEDKVEWSIRSSLLVDKPAINKDDNVEVELVDIADFLHQIDRPIGLIKMDIEGEEIRVLNRMIDLGLTKNIRNIVVETHERFPTLEDSTEELRRRISSLGLKNIDLNWA